jgi:hypothetical protein
MYLLYHRPHAKVLPTGRHANRLIDLMLYLRIDQSSLAIWKPHFGLNNTMNILVKSRGPNIAGAAGCLSYMNYNSKVCAILNIFKQMQI